MPSKLQTYMQMADEAQRQITGSYRGWTGFLTTAARLYKYPYAEQVMIHAQRPDATACAEYDFWNEKMGRYVRRGSKGIALIDSSGERPRLRYVFDVSDTGGREFPKSRYLWEYREEHADAVSVMLESRYGVDGKGGLPDQLERIASQLAEEYWRDYKRDILAIVDDSFLYGYDEFNVGAAFQSAAAVSIAYSLMSRCGLEADDRFEHEDFLSIFDFNTPEAAAELGTAVSRINGEVLRQIEVTIKNYEREKLAERSHSHDRADLHQERGLPDSRPDAERNAGGRETPGQVRETAQELPSGAQTGAVQPSGAVGEAVPASAGDRRDGEPEAGADDAGADEVGGRDGGAESPRPDEMGGADEQPESAGGGDHPQRAGIQLTDDTPEAEPAQPPIPQAYQLSLFPTEDEQIAYIAEAESYTPSAFSMSIPQADIDHILRMEGNADYARMKIATEFSKGKSVEEIAAFLQSSFHGGNGVVTENGRYSAWYAEDGIHIANGDAARYLTSAKVVSWQEAAERIGQLLTQGEYATNVELAEAPGHERTELAQSIWYLRQDLSEKARAQGYEAEFGADGTRVFRDPAAEQVQPTVQELFERYRLSVGNALSKDEAFLNACRNSDRQNAYLEGAAAIRRIVTESGDLQLTRLYFDMPAFHNRLHQELLDELYPTLATTVTPSPYKVTQADIDAALQQWNGRIESKHAVVRYMKAHARDRDTAAWLAREYGLKDTSKPLQISVGNSEPVTLSWAKVQRRIAQLIQSDNFYTEQEQDNFDNIDPIAIREALAERGIVNGQVVDAEANRNSPFVRQVMADVERIAAQEVQERMAQQEEPALDPADRFHVVSLDRGFRTLYAVWDDETHGYYVDADGVTEEFTSEWQAEAYRLELQGQAEQALLERAKGLISDFCRSEYGSEADFSDPAKIGVAYTTVTDDEIPLQVNIDLVNYRLERYLDDEHLETRQYGSLQELISNELENLDFSDLIHVSDEDVEQYRWHEPEETAPAPQREPFPYSVGDTVYLENGKPFIIESIGLFDISLRDPSLRYPVSRAESRESFARLMERYPQPEKTAAENTAVPEKEPNHTYTEETVAVYPADKNNLPYDVEIRTLRFDEPEHDPPSAEPAEPEPPAMSEEEALLLEQEGRAALSEMGEFVPDPDDAISQAEIDEPFAPLPPAENFRILDDNLGKGGAKEKFWRNIKAIATLKQIESENRNATPEEQHILSQYVGWGGLADAFDTDKAGWRVEYDELKGVLTPEEYAAARASTLNAHYTSPTVIRAIYDAVENMGFQTGNILEPSMGVGNFFGMLPESMKSSRLYGVELDSITGRIAKQLYPKADITVAGFETTDRKDFFDLAVGNVPFGQYQVSDRAFDKLGFSIHNYFFAKALEQVRPGGVVAFVTSRYTMDAKDSAARRYIAQRADFLGAIRLPNNAFKANAGTDVVSDIIFLQKRDRPIEIEPDWVHLGANADGFAINRYFIDHPEMVLGRQTSESTQYGRQDFTVAPIEGADLAEQLSGAIRNIRGTYAEAELPDLGEDETIVETIPADPNVRNFSYTVVDEELYYRQNSIMTKPDFNATAKERAKGMVELRDCVQKLISQQMDGFISDETIRQTQAELNTLYDGFTAKYGLINSRANALAFAEDSSYYLLCSLEELDEDKNLKRKADMFTRRTIRAHEAVTSVDTASEALALSISEKACVDMAYMAQLTGKDEDALASDLRGVIFRNPENKRWETADEYLSGNVREKLRIAQSAQNLFEGDYAGNVEALKAAQPKDLDASEIEVRLGATWIDASYIREFMWETFETPFYQQRMIDVTYSAFTAEWNIRNKNAVS